MSSSLLMNMSNNKHQQNVQMEKSCYDDVNQTADIASLITEALLKLGQFHQTILATLERPGVRLVEACTSCAALAWKKIYIMKSKFGLCHNSSAVMTSAKLWPERFITINIKTNLAFLRNLDYFCELVTRGPVASCIGSFQVSAKWILRSIYIVSNTAYLWMQYLANGTVIRRTY